MPEDQSTLLAKCPACNAAYRVPAAAAGKRITCKRCQAAITVPTGAASTARAVTPVSEAMTARTQKNAVAGTTPRGNTTAAETSTALRARPALPKTSTAPCARPAPPKTPPAPCARPATTVLSRAGTVAPHRPLKAPARKPLPLSHARPAATVAEKNVISPKSKEASTLAPSRNRPSQKKVILALTALVAVLLVAGVGGFLFLSRIQKQREAERQEDERMIRLLKDGEDLMRRGNFEAALAKFEQVIAARSRVRWDGFYYRARWNFAQGKYEQAINDATEAVVGNASESVPMTYAGENLFLRARAYIALGRYSDALQDIEEGFRFKDISVEMQATSDRLKSILETNARAIAILKDRLTLLPRSVSALPATPEMFEQCIAFDGWEPIPVPTYMAAQRAIKPDPQVVPAQWPTALIPLPIHGFLGDIVAVLQKEYAEGLSTIVLPVQLTSGELGLLPCAIVDPKNPRRPIEEASLRLAISRSAGRLTFCIALSGGKDAQVVESADALPAAVAARREVLLKTTTSPAPDTRGELAPDRIVPLLLTFEGVFSAQEFVSVLDTVRRCEKVAPLLCLDTPLAMQRSLLSGLGWLVRHQDPRGAWRAEDFDSRCKKNDRCPGKGREENDEALTAFVLLAFLGAGADASLEGGSAERFAGAIESAKDYLRKLQKDDGCFEPAVGRDRGRLMFTHAVITTALAQAVIGGDSTLKDEVARAADFILAGQAEAGGWGYKPRDPQPDTITTGWCMIALRAAEVATGRTADSGWREKALKFLLDLTDSREFDVRYRADAQVIRYEEAGKVKYKFHRTPAAHALVARLIFMTDARAPVIVAGGNLLAARLPNWDELENVDLYHWLVASAGLYLLEGRGRAAERKAWTAWYSAVVPLLLQKQNMEPGTCLEGSWDAIDKWSWAGGRPYSTAAASQTLAILLGEEGFLRRLGR